MSRIGELARWRVRGSRSTSEDIVGRDTENRGYAGSCGKNRKGSNRGETIAAGGASCDIQFPGPVFRPPGTGGYSNQHSDPIRELLYSDSSPSSSLQSWEPIAEDPSGSHDRLGPTYGAYDALCEKRCFMSPLTTYCRIPSGRLKYPCSHARTSYAEYAYHLEYVGVGERTKSEENPNLVKITEVVTHGFPTSTHSTVLIDIYSPMGRRCRRNLTKLRILCGVEAPNM